LWVHPKIHFLQWTVFISHWQKNHDIFWYSLSISIFYQYGTIVVLFQEISWMHILPPNHCWIKLLWLLLFLYNFQYWVLFIVIHCKNLLWFIFTHLISCGASQSTNVFLQWAILLFSWPITKNLWNSPLLKFFFFFFTWSHKII
jgi:hypothetical protein